MGVGLRDDKVGILKVVTGLSDTQGSREEGFLDLNLLHGQLTNLRVDQDSFLALSDLVQHKLALCDYNFFIDKLELRFNFELWNLYV